MPQGETVRVQVTGAAAKMLRGTLVVPTSKGRTAAGQFRKGHSGVVVAKNERQFDLAELARAHAPQAIQVLVEVMGDKKAPHTARTSAASALLDRGYGRPAMKVETSGGEDLRQMHLDALKAVAHAAATGGAMGAMAGAAAAAERVGAAAYFAERQQQIAVQAAVIEAEVETPKPETVPLKVPRKPVMTKAQAVARAAKMRAAKAAKKASSVKGAAPSKGEGEPDSPGQPRPSLAALAAALKAKAEADDDEDDGQVVQL